MNSNQKEVKWRNALASSSMKVSAYIPSYNARETIGETIRSIVDQTVPVEELFVVDDGSTDGFGDVSGVSVIRCNSNAGRGAARAQAMAKARHELVLGCDATAILDPDFLENALPWFSNARVAGVFGRLTGGPMLSLANRWRERHLFQSSLRLEVRHHASLATYCCLVRKSAVEKVGGFDATLRAGEDVELGERLLAAGFDVIFDPRLNATSVINNSVAEVLERYARWNTLQRMTVRGYLRQLSYALKVMAVKDFKAKDPFGACISLLAPHYQFWKGVVFR
jgi:glycosyltransferase involved in cell wall biosynthesis